MTDDKETKKLLHDKFNANLFKHAEQILKLHERYRQATLGGIGMKAAVPVDSLGETFAQARMIYLAESKQKEKPTPPIEAIKLYTEGFCEGILLGVFLSELGLAALITREK
jgi:hypothetical protein